MIIIRPPESIYQARGVIENGTFEGRWHFSFDQYYDPEFEHFGTLRVFNDDTLSPGATWPLHPHRDIEPKARRKRPDCAGETLSSRLRPSPSPKLMTYTSSSPMPGSGSNPP